MEAIILIGIQGAGKSTFYRQRFFDTHLRINLDMLRTRRREDILLRACIEAGQGFVVDNTNPMAQTRAKYIQLARPVNFRLVAYYFVPDLKQSLLRNLNRSGKQVIPPAVIASAAARLEPPTLEEGFDELHEVRINNEGQFVVS